MRIHVRLAVLGLVLTTFGCASDRPLIPPLLEIPARSAGDVAAPQATTPPVTSTSPTPRMPPIDRTSTARESPRTQAAVDEKADVTLAFDQVPLPSFAQIVFGNILKRNVQVDPAIASRQDLVTLRTGKAQTPSQVADVARQVLRGYGVAAVEAGDVVRIVPDNAASGVTPEIRVGSALPDTPQPLRPMFYLVELRSVQRADVLNWIRAMFDKRVEAREDINRNAVMLSGKSDDVMAAVEAIQVLDQPLMKGRRSLRINPVYWSPDELARRLGEILRAEGYSAGVPSGAIQTAITLLPVAGANAVFVFAADEKIVSHVVEWARELDKPNDRGGGRNIFSYKVQNTDAEVLAKTLNQVLSGAAPGVVPAAAPGAPVAAPPQAARLGSVIVDRATNTLIFQGRAEDYGDIRNLLQNLDQPAKGALIEVTVAEVTLTDETQLGIEWLAREAGLAHNRSASFGTLGGLSIGTSGFNYRLFSDAGEVRLLINALASNNRATILSSPRVMARNGESATIQVGQEVPIITSQQVAVGTGGIVLPPTTTAVPQTIQYRNTGVILNVKPVIYAGDRIDLDIAQEVSFALPTTTGVSNSPTFSSRKVQTRLSLKSGSTVLLGGLIGENRSRGNAGIPFLKDIPIFGQLFRTDTGKEERTELVVLIRPHIISDDQDAQEVTRAFRNQLSPWAGEPGPAKP